MATDPMSDYDRKRILQLALKKHTVKQIAERLGFAYDRVRRMIERAEQRNEVPAGTLQRCGIAPRKPKEVAPVEPLRIYAPSRSHAANLGHCSACTDVVEVVLEVNHPNCTEQLRFCRTHAPAVSGGIELALMDAEKIRKATTLLPRVK